MSDLPHDDEEAGEADALYRRVAAAEPTQPGEGVRLAVLAYATRRAAQAASESGVVPKEYSWQRRVGAWGRPAAFGALAAGILAAFMLGPRISGPPPVTVPAVSEDRAAAAAPPPLYADLNNSSLPQEAAPSSVVATPQEKAARVPADALRRQNTAPAAAAARLANVPTAAPAAQGAAERSEVTGGVDARRARDVGAPAETATAPVATSAGASLAKSEEPEERAALLRAAANGDLATLRDLHARGADLNATDAAGRTALMLATQNRRAPAVEALLGFGADPNIVDARGDSPLAVALAAHEGEIASALKRHGAR